MSEPFDLQTLKFMPVIYRTTGDYVVRAYLSAKIDGDRAQAICNAFNTTADQLVKTNPKKEKLPPLKAVKSHTQDCWCVQSLTLLSDETAAKASAELHTDMVQNMPQESFRQALDQAGQDPYKTINPGRF